MYVTKTNNGGSAYGGAISGYLTQGVGGGMFFSYLNGGSPVEALRINYQGYIGIGTTGPTYPLTVNGGVAIGNRLLGSHNSGGDLYWIGLQGTNATEGNRLCIGIQSIKYSVIYMYFALEVQLYFEVLILVLMLPVVQNESSSVNQLHQT